MTYANTLNRLCGIALDINRFIFVHAYKAPESNTIVIIALMRNNCIIVIICVYHCGMCTVPWKKNNNQQ